MEASRIANVSAALLIGAARTAAAPRSAGAAGIAGLLGQLFEQTVRIDAVDDAARPGGRSGDPGRASDGVDGLATAILASRAERVIVVGDGDPLASAEALLALVAWPEKPVVLVVPDAPGPPAAPSAPFGIFRRDALEGRARAQLESAKDAPDLETFLDGLEIERVSLAQLGLSSRPIPPFAGPPVGPVRAS